MPVHDLNRAVQHPLRIRIIHAIGDGTKTPRALSEELGETLGTTSYHVRVLNDFGALKLVKTRQVRGAIAHYYSLHPKTSEEVRARIGALGSVIAGTRRRSTVEDVRVGELVLLYSGASEPVRVTKVHLRRSGDVTLSVAGGTWTEAIGTQLEVVGRALTTREDPPAL